MLFRWSDAVLNAINTRLDAEAIGFILNHGEARMLIVDPEFSDVAERAVHIAGRPIEMVDILDPEFEGGHRVGAATYDDLLEEGTPDFRWERPADEWDAISLNYTSGTTGDPKGVVYHHRGAYLNAIGNILTWNMANHPVYLWTLPMFHCNGWCFPWTIAAAAGISVCLRAVRVEPIYDLIKREKVTHFCGAPIVLNLLAHAPDDVKAGIEHKVSVMTAGAAPPAAVIESMEAMGFDVTHAYGLTETYGPAVVCAWHDEWNDLDISEKARLKAPPGRALLGARRPDGRRSGDAGAGSERRRDDGGNLLPRQQRHARLSQEPVLVGQGLCGRLVPFRRPRRLPSRRLYRDQGPVEGYLHFRRREHLVDRGRGRALPPPRP